MSPKILRKMIKTKTKEKKEIEFILIVFMLFSRNFEQASQITPLKHIL
jgi:hypothetical protein